MKLEKKALGISLYLFIASFFSERLWFNSDHLNLHNSIYIITKVMLLFTLIILGQVLYKGIIRVLQKDENAVFFAKVFFVYFILLITVLLLIWPGIWRWDEFWMIDGSKWFYVAAAQNFLMSFFLHLLFEYFTFSGRNNYYTVTLCFRNGSIFCGQYI